MSYTSTSYDVSSLFTLSKRFFFGPSCYKHVHRQEFNTQCICDHHISKVSLRQWCPQLTTLYYTLVLWRISSPLFFGVNLSENGSRNYSFYTHRQKCTLLWMQNRCAEQVTSVNNDTALYLQSVGIIFWSLIYQLPSMWIFFIFISLFEKMSTWFINPSKN